MRALSIVGAATLAISGVMLVPGLGLWLGGAGYIALLTWGVRRRLVGQRMIRRNDEALALLAAGDLQESATTLDELAAGGRNAPGLHALVVANRATVALRMGELEKAQVLYRSALESRWFHIRRGAFPLLLPVVLAGRATCEALLERHDEADALRREALDNVSAAKRGVLLLMDAIVLTRRGDFEAALASIDRDANRAENFLSAPQRRTLRLLEAFAFERTKGSGYRDEPMPARLRLAIEEAREAQGGQVGYLSARWPELRAFLQRHHVVAG